MVPTWIRPWLLAALFSYGVFAMYWYFMAGFAHGWQYGDRRMLDARLAEPVDWDSLEAASAGDDSLLTVNSHGRDPEAESCMQAGDCQTQCQAAGQVTAGLDQPVLNCLVTPPKIDPNDRQQQIERLIRRSHPKGLTYVLRRHDRQLAVAARLQGEAEALACGASGRCYLVAELPNLSDNTVFVSDDFGQHWRLAAQQTLKKAYAPKIVAIDGERVWLKGFKRLYRSSDGGRHWQVLIDTDRVMAYHPELLTSSLYSDNMTDHFDWYMDDSGRLYAVTGGQYRRAPNTVMYQIDADSGELLAATKYDGAFIDIERSPTGALFGIFRSNTPERYTLYRLRAGELQPLVETGNERMSSLRAGRRLLMFNRGQNDGEFIALSRDGGRHWRPMNTFYFDQRMLFDPTGGGFLHIGYKNRGTQYPYHWQQP
ncbi:WD40/YVTN/BNR-like repeat-containing protein [Salinisphaera hydrothermalis]|uniref:WD40/YVTN/BNR-like repeat-containing protein n=1 Tax=Salinisphaera hydrothermalis TaxID=563188 RepID=UPI00333FF74F